MTVVGYGEALGAGTIINAIATLKGAAFGVDMKTRSKVELSHGSGGIKGVAEGVPDADTKLIELAVQKTLKQFGLKMEGIVSTQSEIPMASGLKSSSAAANATVLATLDAIGETMEPLDAVNLGVDAAKEAGVTITGAFDDACASFFGGVVVTDNSNNTLLERVKRKDEVLILVPDRQVFSSKTDVLRSKAIAPWIEMAYDLALAGEYEKAMTLNGMLYCGALGFDTKPLMIALDCGIHGVSLSGTGPSYVALMEGNDSTRLENAWKKYDPAGKMIKTEINNVGALTIV
ncbi:shikimate kinase [Methanohalophilus levihalophilus]|uniref:shikimate kinase n=1 Tax=Methanohalophilus levihalophilus TaxID=1431282 RepID=UPI001AE98846|nr:shikimate kinase [Methanohalophilus levihalophilus]MBP2029549.1 shikimate kinase [Methanohalophilus levihalophilus]